MLLDLIFTMVHSLQVNSFESPMSECRLYYHNFKSSILENCFHFHFDWNCVVAEVLSVIFVEITKDSS